MITVVVALIPVTLFGMWNVGYQANSSLSKRVVSAGDKYEGDWHYTVHSATRVYQRPDQPRGQLSFSARFSFLADLHRLHVRRAATLNLVFSVLRGHEINEGFPGHRACSFRSRFPASIPLWQVALGIAFGVIVAKEVFGGTGRNFLNVALTSRAFLYFAYAGQISGDKVWTVGGRFQWRDRIGTDGECSGW